MWLQGKFDYCFLKFFSTRNKLNSLKATKLSTNQPITLAPSTLSWPICVRSFRIFNDEFKVVKVCFLFFNNIRSVLCFYCYILKKRNHKVTMISDQKMQMDFRYCRHVVCRLSAFFVRLPNKIENESVCVCVCSE